MIVIGIDPGSRRVGYGVIKKIDGKINFVSAGILPMESKTDIDSIREIKKQVDILLKNHQPAALGIERLYVTKNQKTAVQTAQARGVILLSASEAGVPVYEFSPSEVKANATGYGLADKPAVAKMVRLMLGEPDLKLIDDATDALAIAIATSGRLYERGVAPLSRGC